MVDLKAVIFDLDGVLCHTDGFHLEAWRILALSKGLSLPRDFSVLSRGVGRMESLDILLGERRGEYSEEEKEIMAKEKNNYYQKMIESMTPSDLALGAIEILTFLRERGIKIALGSSSRNALAIIDRLGISRFFDAVVDGNAITRGKPDPEVFIKAAEALNVSENQALVVEDSLAGIIASRIGGFMTSSISEEPIPGGVMIPASSLIDLMERLRIILDLREY